MGRFSVDIELGNNDDMARARVGDIPTDEIRRVTVRGVVDSVALRSSGATRLVIPESVARQLGLEASGETTVRYADGRTAQRRMAIGIHLAYAGRGSVFNAVIEPDRDSALVGAIVLEDLDLVIDCTRQALSPRDPKRIISEVE